MTEGEAEGLIQQREGRLCLRFYRRSDGTILTQDCPVGLLAWRRRLRPVLAAVIGATIAIAAHVVGALGLSRLSPSVRTGDHASLWRIEDRANEGEQVITGMMVETACNDVVGYSMEPLSTLSELTIPIVEFVDFPDPRIPDCSFDLYGGKP